MDTLTHALSGALLARAGAPPRSVRSPLTGHEWMLTGFCAAAFPDADYLYYLVDRLEYLNVHQGSTHSLLLWPLWSAALGLALALLFGKPRCWRWFTAAAALGVAAHIGGDLLTAFGVQAFAPLSSARFSLRTTFVIDPYFSALVIAGLAVSRTRWGRAGAVGALGLLAAYVAAQSLLQQRALEVARSHAATEGLENARVYALAQPFHPFNWKLLVGGPRRYDEAYLNLATRAPSPFVFPADSTLGRMARAYRPAHDLRWREHRRLADHNPAHPDVRAAWRQPALAGFRRFARFPVLHRVAEARGERCLWFTDLRYTLPELRPPFRYGACRHGPGALWRAYRLRFFTDDARQPLQ
ncbi:MAG: metal-dependent hydrolase [Gammaproteobacteria bacterium]|nr:metal-dependent hydrolase [Gammaproteobacteria bacterium]NIR83809.1 metal-dependent hydrolase [Gammaproteobacteria bacterium]NIR88226.1 metal-dependent hydrolase [Gammaproteobacteria bacterium]NIU05135.1 metal-dependent hydrolase [Gammaproteobacteria bacterium]NIV51972.1 metal-dependent hydrolase [Gammaproteobacteria bacterium]